MANINKYVRKLHAQELVRLSPAVFQISKKIPLTLVLDNVRSAHNVGACFRIADAFLLEKIYLCGITAAPPHKAIHKTALGAEEHVQWAHVKDTSTAVHKLQASGHQVLAVEQTTASQPLQTFVPRAGQPYALVFGHEVTGVQETVVSICDGHIAIPQQGVKHSLNVSVCAGIVVWTVAQGLARAGKGQM